MNLIELRTIEEKVKYILVNDPETRDSDKKLIASFIGTFVPNLSLMTFKDAMTDEMMPSPETIRRTRQKIQASIPSLKASREVEIFRDENEAVFTKYARGGV